MEGEAPVRELDYLRGLRATVGHGVEYGIHVIEVGQDKAPSIPQTFRSQPRLAARHRVPLDMVLRRLFAGKTLLAHSMLEEASRIGLSNPDYLYAAIESLETTFDRIIATAQEEYRREEEQRAISPDDRILRDVQRLLDGEVREWLLASYNSRGHHLGVVTRSPDARAWIRSVAGAIGLRSLVLMPCQEEVWGWLGSSAPIDVTSVRRHLADVSNGQVSIGMGRSEQDADGWRLTHRQARAAAAISIEGSITLYEEVALLVALSRDPLLATSLRDMFLRPLSGGPERGHVLRATLRAYFEADRNGSSAAAALGVSRQTVANRLQTVEERVNQPLSTCGDLLYAALRLEELGFLGPAVDIV